MSAHQLMMWSLNMGLIVDQRIINKEELIKKSYIAINLVIENYLAKRSIEDFVEEFELIWGIDLSNVDIPIDPSSQIIVIVGDIEGKLGSEIKKTIKSKFIVPPQIVIVKYNEAKPTNFMKYARENVSDVLIGENPHSKKKNSLQLLESYSHIHGYPRIHYLRRDTNNKLKSSKTLIMNKILTESAFIKKVPSNLKY